MSISSNCSVTGTGPPEVALPNAARPLQRLAIVRRLQGLSRRTVARRMNVDLEQVRRQEAADADLPLSVLYAWQKALEVPVAELLVEPGDVDGLAAAYERGESDEFVNATVIGEPVRVEDGGDLGGLHG